MIEQIFENIFLAIWTMVSVVARGSGVLQRGSSAVLRAAFGSGIQKH
jgi:hypothetical protein